MSFAAEPYGAFVDDLLSGLTGGVVREEFVFTEEHEPFRLAAGADTLAGTVRVHGLAGGAFRRFADGVDYEVEAGTIGWLTSEPGVPAAGATWPDRGSRFYASYERTPDPQARPRLTDRNPGSVVRILAESFAREYAVVSRQLELVYQGAFVETAEGSDLDKVVALVGIERRGRTVASGEVVFSRATPAPADVFVPAGTLISTGEVPAVTVETADDRTLRSGTLSVAAPVRATVEGPAGVAPAGSLTVIHRPILGIEAVTNPQAMTFGGGAETDESLRRRASRALEAGGRSTVGAITGALTSVEGIREQDVRIVEDHLSFPGVVKIAVASELTPAAAARAAALVEEARPAGIRVLHNLPVTPAPSLPPAGDTHGQDPGPPAVSPPSQDMWFPIGVTAVVTPAGASLTAAQKGALTAAVHDAVQRFADALGVGETIVYNRLVAAIMAVDGVSDVSLDLFPAAAQPPAGRRNLVPAPADTRPRLDVIDVTLRGALIALDVAAVIERRGLAATADPASALADARADIARRLADLLSTATGVIDKSALRGGLPDTATYHVEDISYTAEFVDEGLRVSAPDREIDPGDDQQPWLRTVSVTEKVATT